MTNTELDIQLFDSKAHFVMPSMEIREKLSPDRQQRLDALKVASDVNDAAEAKLKQSTAELRAAVEAHAALEAEVAKAFPPKTQTDLAREFQKLSIDGALRARGIKVR